jgi:hypothetical protein
MIKEQMGKIRGLLFFEKRAKSQLGTHNEESTE